MDEIVWLETLDSWRKEAPVKTRPQWSVSSYGSISFSVRLTWYRDTQLCNIQQAAPSIQEAVWQAMEEFRRIQW